MSFSWLDPLNSKGGKAPTFNQFMEKEGSKRAPKGVLYMRIGSSSASYAKALPHYF